MTNPSGFLCLLLLLLVRRLVPLLPTPAQAREGRTGALIGVLAVDAALPDPELVPPKDLHPGATPRLFNNLKHNIIT